MQTLIFRRVMLLLTGFAAASALCGCVVVGHSTGGGWFIWPGGLGLVVVVLLALFLLRRR